MRYYDLKRHWAKRIVPHLDNKELNDILVTDFDKFTCGRWLLEFKPGGFPDEYESCDWRLKHKAPYPRFWRYVKHSACHWIVNFTLKLAMLVEPNRNWRIISSDAHSTVWDGDKTLFDFNFQALGISPQECYDSATGKGCEHLEPGAFMEVSFANAYVFELRNYELLKSTMLEDIPPRFNKLSDRNKRIWLGSLLKEFEYKHKRCGHFCLLDRPLVHEFIASIELPKEIELIGERYK